MIFLNWNVSTKKFFLSEFFNLSSGIMRVNFSNIFVSVLLVSISVASATIA